MRRKCKRIFNVLAVFSFSEDLTAVVLFAGDVRVSFSILLTAGHLDERDGKTKIELNDLETAARAAEVTF